MDWVSLIITALDLAGKLIDRANQSGELTPAQNVALQELANSIFAAHTKPAQPPPGVTPGPD